MGYISEETLNLRDMVCIEVLKLLIDDVPSRLYCLGGKPMDFLLQRLKGVYHAFGI
jgi:hypothetical protein